MKTQLSRTVGRRCICCNETKKLRIYSYTLSRPLTYVTARIKCLSCRFKWGETTRLSKVDRRRGGPLEFLAHTCSVKKTRRARKTKKKMRGLKAYSTCLECRAKSIHGGYVQQTKDGYSVEGCCGICGHVASFSLVLESITQVDDDSRWIAFRNVRPSDVKVGW